jgi:hypothetical protein
MADHRLFGTHLACGTETTTSLMISYRTVPLLALSRHLRHRSEIVSCLSAGAKFFDVASCAG